MEELPDIDTIYDEIREAYMNMAKIDLVDIIMDACHFNQEDDDLINDYLVLIGIKSYNEVNR